MKYWYIYGSLHSIELDVYDWLSIGLRHLCLPRLCSTGVSDLENGQILEETPDFPATWVALHLQKKNKKRHKIRMTRLGDFFANWATFGCPLRLFEKMKWPIEVATFLATFWLNCENCKHTLTKGFFSQCQRRLGLNPWNWDHSSSGLPLRYHSWPMKQQFEIPLILLSYWWLAIVIL